MYNGFMGEIENLRDLQDDVLDQYNDGKISEKEMQNILKWCERQKEKPEEIINEFSDT